MDANVVTLIVGIAGGVAGLLSAVRLATFHWGRLRRVERLVELREKVAGSSRSLVDEMIHVQLGALNVRWTRDADDVARRGAYVLGWASVAVFFVMAATTTFWAALPPSIVIVTGGIFLASAFFALIFSLTFLAFQIAQMVKDLRAFLRDRRERSTSLGAEGHELKAAANSHT